MVIMGKNVMIETLMEEKYGLQPVTKNVDGVAVTMVPIIYFFDGRAPSRHKHSFFI